MAGEIGEFDGETTFVPEAFFRDAAANRKLFDFFESLPPITTGRLSEHFRQRLRPEPEREPLMAEDSARGIFIFEEPEIAGWASSKTPYELVSVPERPLTSGELPGNIQELLKPYRFANLKFADCQFLDVSRHFYCED